MARKRLSMRKTREILRHMGRDIERTRLLGESTRIVGFVTGDCDAVLTRDGGEHLDGGVALGSRVPPDGKQRDGG